MAKYKVGDAVTYVGHFSAKVYRGTVISAVPADDLVINLFQPMKLALNLSPIRTTSTSLTDTTLRHLTPLEVLLYA